MCVCVCCCCCCVCMLCVCVCVCVHVIVCMSVIIMLNSLLRPQLQKTDKPGGPPVEGLYDKPAAVANKSNTPLFTGKSPERRQVN